MVDNNKSEEGIENEVLACNTLCKEDAIRGIGMLKSAIAGEKIKKSERAWNPNIKENNLEILEKTYEIKVDRVPNETNIPQSR